MKTRQRKSRKQTTQQRAISLIPILLDEELTFAGRPAGQSVLTLPLGTRTVLACLLEELTACRHRRTLILSEHAVQDYPIPASHEVGEVQVVAASHLPEFFATCETSDFLMIVQPRFWPTLGHDFASIASSAACFRGATHGIAVGGLNSGARERIVCDASGRIRRVHRLYDEMNWPEAASSTILCSLVPLHLLHNTNMCSPAALRTTLAARGVLTQDVPLHSDLDDLAEPAGLLSVSERTIGHVLQSGPVEGYSLRGEDVLVGDDCRIHRSARLVGPMIVQAGAVIDAEAQIIGPALIGRNAHVERGAVVTGSLLGIGTTVATKSTTSHEVVFSRAQATATGNSASTPRSIASESLSLKGLGSYEPVDWRPGNKDHQRSVQLSIKRLIDILGSAFGLILLLPMLLVVGVLVKLTSPGPVFFIHRRERKDGTEFPCIKFRSMVADAHLKQRELYKQNQVDGPQFKMDRDPRETTLGRWLRRMNIDELPQLTNVLLGHMSLVGPRPSPFRENQICVPWRRARLSVRPGITGLWQLCRDRTEEADFHQWIYYDLMYVRNYTLLLDFKILFHTVLSGGGRRRVPLGRLIKDAPDPENHAAGEEQLAQGGVDDI